MPKNKNNIDDVPMARININFLRFEEAVRVKMLLLLLILLSVVVLQGLTVVNSEQEAKTKHGWPRTWTT